MFVSGRVGGVTQTYSTPEMDLPMQNHEQQDGAVLIFPSRFAMFCEMQDHASINMSSTKYLEKSWMNIDMFLPLRFSQSFGGLFYRQAGFWCMWWTGHENWPQQGPGSDNFLFPSMSILEATSSDEAILMYDGCHRWWMLRFPTPRIGRTR